MLTSYTDYFKELIMEPEREAEIRAIIQDYIKNLPKEERRELLYDGIDKYVQDKVTQFGWLSLRVLGIAIAGSLLKLWFVLNGYNLSSHVR